MVYTTSVAGVNLIKQFEGCLLTAYQDSVGVWTIGYGHTAGVKQGQVIMQQQAEDFLRADLFEFEKAVNKLVLPPIKQNQFDALVSFTYNLGTGTLEKSTLLAELNKGNIVEAGMEFCKFTRAGNVRLLGLLRRRLAEATLFCS